MNGLLKRENYDIRLFAGETQSLVYTIMDEEQAAAVWNLIIDPKPTLAVICGVDWNCDLSPWPMPKAFRGGEDFGGGAPGFLRVLTEQILPLTEQALGFIPVSRCIAGYSLAGLFALWCACDTNVFDRVASMSGSLWYDGFLDYMERNPPRTKLERVYLSLGDKEKATKNARMAKVEECTFRAKELLQEHGIYTDIVLNPGGHFQNVPGRIAKGINMLVL